MMSSGHHSGHSHSGSFSASSSFNHQRTPSSNSIMIPQLSNPNSTRILLLSGFPPELKTRDIQALFGEWEHQGGGLKIKWRDDESCFIVFQDPPVAKRAYLSLLGNPPPGLQPSGTHVPTLKPYTAEDVPQIIQSVAARPRSRSNAGAGAHQRKGSMGGNGGPAVGGANGHQRGPSFGREGGQGPPGMGMGHAHRGSRSSFGQLQMKQMMGDNPAEQDESAIDEAEAPPPVPAVPAHLADQTETVESKELTNPGQYSSSDVSYSPCAERCSSSVDQGKECQSRLPPGPSQGSPSRHENFEA